MEFHDHRDLTKQKLGEGRTHTKNKKIAIH